MYIVIHDLDCFVLLCIDIRLNTLSVFMAHELDFSWVKIVTMRESPYMPSLMCAHLRHRIPVVVFFFRCLF